MPAENKDRIGSSATGNPASDSWVKGGSISLLRQPDVYYGQHFGTALAEIVLDRNCQRILPVVTPSLLGNPMVAAGIAAVGSSALSTFSGLKPHTPCDVVLLLTEEIRRTNPDLIVVVGGGSAIDAVKIARMAVAADVHNLPALQRLSLMARAPSVAVERSCPVVAVSTTLSGAEFGMIGGASDLQSGIKLLFKSDSLMPDTVVLDPWLAAATPLDLWLSTGIRSVDHAAETVLSRDASPYTDTLALKGLALLKEGLIRCREQPDDVGARYLCQLGMWHAACGIGRLRYGASHGLGHQLGVLGNVPHGITSCVLLPTVLAFNEAVSTDQQAQIADAFGRSDMRASDVVRELIAALGLPTRISQLGLKRDALPRIAESSLANPFVLANLRPIKSVSDAQQVLDAAF